MSQPDLPNVIASAHSASDTPQPNAVARRVLLGVAAGISAYKSAEVVRRLRESGCDVRVVMTARATEFVGSTTFQALSGNPVRTSLWDTEAEAAMSHIELARWAELVIIAPATADLIARIAHGFADDLLTTLVLAIADDVPLLLAPAMNQAMWAHAATRANIATLVSRGVRCVGPDSGSQACGDVGAGRMAETPQLIAAVLEALPRATGGGTGLFGKRVLVTAGPTFEDVDPVRFIGNRSSGRMGFALAEAARAAGATVTLIAGPVTLPTPHAVRRIDVRSAAEMLDAVRGALDGADLFIANAAVADFTPVAPSPHKIKKQSAALEVALKPTVDILAEVAATEPRPFVVGFAAETRDLETHARMKLEQKRLDLIIANPVGTGSSGFEVDRNEALALWEGGSRVFAPSGKAELASALIDLIASRMQHDSRFAP